MKIGPFLNFHDRILLFASPKPQCIAWHVLLTAGLSPAMLNKKHVCFWQLETVGNCKPLFKNSSRLADRNGHKLHATCWLSGRAMPS